MRLGAGRLGMLREMLAPLPAPRQMRRNNVVGCNVKRTGGVDVVEGEAEREDDLAHDLHIQAVRNDAFASANKKHPICLLQSCFFFFGYVAGCTPDR